MSQATHYETAPEDRIPFQHKLIYGLGAFVNNLLAAAIGGMVIVLNLGLGMNPALVGLLGALPRLTDALTDPLMGYISDNTRSRWGRRRPYIFVGAIAAGIIFALLWQLPARPERDLLLLVLPDRLADLLPGLHGLRDAVGGARLRADARLPRAHAPDGRAELHRPARLRGLALVPADHAEQDLFRRHGGRRGRAGDHHRAWSRWRSASCRPSSCANAFKASPRPKSRSEAEGHRQQPTASAIDCAASPTSSAASRPRSSPRRS